MKNRKSFLKGALCGALAMLLVAGLVSCGLKVNNGNSDITSKTEDKISELQNLIEKHYMGDVKEKNLEETVQNALKQIADKEYDTELIARGIPKERIRHFGFAFEGKKF